jgi:hypothetical protein
MSSPSKKPKKPNGPPAKKRTVAVLTGSGQGYVTQFVHYLTGQLMVAEKYGYKAWPFGYGRKG